MSNSRKPGPLFAEAFTYALELHDQQVRKQADGEDPRDGIPYMGHLMMVAALVLEHGGGETEAIAALLHDGPEDQGGKATLAAIRERFGPEVAEIVDVCTDTFEDPKPPWWPRKRAYCERLLEAPDGALLVSLADKTHNAEASFADVTEYGEAFWRRFTQERRGLLWYYATLLRIYRKRVPGSRFPRAVRLVDRLEGAFEGMFPSAEERRAALSFGPEDSASPMSDALAAFVSAARSCVDEMVANAVYIEKELPAVSLPEDLERATKKICSGLVETRFDVVSELRELGDVDPSDDPKGVQRQVAMVVRWLGEDLPDLNALVRSLESAKAAEPELCGGYILVAESAANILRSFVKVSEAEDRLREALRGEEASPGNARGSGEQ